MAREWFCYLKSKTDMGLRWRRVSGETQTRSFATLRREERSYPSCTAPTLPSRHVPAKFPIPIWFHRTCTRALRRFLCLVQRRASSCRHRPVHPERRAQWSRRSTARTTIRRASRCLRPTPRTVSSRKTHSSTASFRSLDQQARLPSVNFLADCLMRIGRLRPSVECLKRTRSGVALRG